MEQKETNYIHLENANSGAKEGDNIFTELGEELDFGSMQSAEKKNEKTDWIGIWHTISYVVMVLCIIIGIGATLDIYLKTSTNNDIISLIPSPVCQYVAAYNLGDTPNDACKTVSMLKTELSDKLQKLEDTIGTNMYAVLPKRLQLASVISLPEVSFIQEHTNNTRVNIVDMLTQFQLVKNASSLYGSSIDCTPESINEKGELDMTCSAYGGRLLGQGDMTSRQVAAEFLDKLNDAMSQFTILEMPKSLDIAQFNSADPGKAVFNSQTNFPLKLKFTPNTKL